MKRTDAVRVMAADIAENGGRLSRLGLRVMVENRIAVGSESYREAVRLGRALAETRERGCAPQG